MNATSQQVFSPQPHAKERQLQRIREMAVLVRHLGAEKVSQQAEMLGLGRSLTHQIMNPTYKSYGVSAAVVIRMLKHQRLPLPVRDKLMLYLRERAAGLYGHNLSQIRRFRHVIRQAMDPDMRGSPD
jgi:hypothetical protein